MHAQVIQTIRLILSILPLILEAVKVVEAALPQSGQGAAKMALVRQAIEAGYSVASDAVVSFEQAWPALERVINASVALFNSAGEFKKS